MRIGRRVTRAELDFLLALPGMRLCVGDAELRVTTSAEINANGRWVPIGAVMQERLYAAAQDGRAAYMLSASEAGHLQLPGSKKYRRVLSSFAGDVHLEYKSERDNANDRKRILLIDGIADVMRRGAKATHKDSSCVVL